MSGCGIFGVLQYFCHYTYLFPHPASHFLWNIKRTEPPQLSTITHLTIVAYWQHLFAHSFKPLQTTMANKNNTHMYIRVYTPTHTTHIYIRMNEYMYIVFTVYMYVYKYRCMYVYTYIVISCSYQVVTWLRIGYTILNRTLHCGKTPKLLCNSCHKQEAVEHVFVDWWLVQERLGGTGMKGILGCGGYDQGRKCQFSSDQFSHSDWTAQQNLADALSGKFLSLLWTSLRHRTSHN